MSASTVATPGTSTPTASENGPSASPVGIPDDGLYEILDGRVVEKAAGASEVDIASLLFEFLAAFARTHRLGRVFPEMLFQLDASKDLQRRPDLAFVSRARWPFHRRLPSAPAWDIVPDLAIEVVSPSNSADDVLQKIHDYFKAGASRVWVVYPRNQEIYVYSSPTAVQILQLGQELDGGEVLPGFRLPLAALFEDDVE